MTSSEQDVLAAYPESGDWTVTRLDSGAVLGNGAILDGDDGCRVAAGVVLLTDAELAGAVASQGAVMTATRAVAAALEVTDADGRPRALVMGPALRQSTDLDLSLVGMLLEIDGVQATTAAGAAAAGHPAAAAASGLKSWRETAPAGSLFFSGRWTPAYGLEPGSHVRASFGHLGTVWARRESA